MLHLDSLLPPQRFSSLRLATGLGLLLLLSACGPKQPELDLETGTIEAPPALPPVSTQEVVVPDLRPDPMAPPSEVPNLPEQSTEAVEPNQASSSTASQTSDAPPSDEPHPKPPVTKSMIQVPN